VFPVIAARTASASPKGTMSNPGANGPNPVRATGSVLKPTIVVVRPWNPPSHTTMRAWSAGAPLRSYPHLRAALLAVSTASAPVFIARSSIPVSAQLLAEPSELVVVERPAGQCQPVELRAGGRHQGWVTVTEAQRGVRRQHVQVAPALHVPDPHTFPIGDHQGQGGVVGRAVALHQAQVLRRAHATLERFPLAGRSHP
jgi:hypothetical protein